MLAEDRYTHILRQVDAQGSVSVGELCRCLGVSEATVRRDLAALDKAGRLARVFGGATRKEYSVDDEPMAVRRMRCRREKELIAQQAAALLEKGDFIYLDAGTSTWYMIEGLPGKLPPGIRFVTNSPSHACGLSRRGSPVYLLGGRLKESTEAVVGAAALESLERYHFTKGFFGANGIDLKGGVTTPDPEEATVKREALLRCGQPYIMADSSKFGVVCAGLICDFFGATVLTTAAAGEEYLKYKHIWEAGER